MKVFITDVDLLIAKEYFGIDHRDYIIIRLFVVFILIFALWKGLGNKRFWKNIGLFFLLPIYPGLWKILKNLFWRLPKVLIKKKQNFLLFIYAESVAGLIVNFKSTILKGLIFTFAFYIVFFSTNMYLLIWGIILLLISQTLHLYKRWNELFGPIKIFQMTLSPIEEDKIPTTLAGFENSIKKNVENAKKDKKDPIIIEMEQYLILHEMMKAFDKKLKDVLTSQTYIKTFMLRGCYSFLFAMIIFGGINYCLFKISPLNFNVSETPNYFDFFYYSFFNIISEGVDVEPITRLSKSFRMIGVSVGVLINFLILAVYFTVNSERYKKNLEQMNLWTSKFSDKLNTKFHDKYSHSPEEGESVLKSVGSEWVKHISDLRKLIYGK